MKVLRIIPLVLMFIGPTLLHASDPFLGKWNLDTKHSKYPPGFCPKQMSIEMTAAEHGVHYHSETLMISGNSFSADYTADYDEKPVIVSGAKGILLPVSLKRTEPNVVIASYISGLQVRATSRRALSRNGTVMTVTTTSRDGEGRTVTNVSVYNRSAPAQRRLDLSKVNAADLVTVLQ
ncbi:hypothetical protein [Granulicella sp. dw_53]|uniref:hypothetical protein n=1 Tax=Granulicella sp. dw_53 TaxID=2719792 RepID=UPI001BD55B9E|nr:hypothetical protein [Granulicella sp. dw_53]